MSPAEIKALRERLQLTQTEFGAKLGTPLRTVQRWEDDTGGPSARTPRGPAVVLMNRLKAEADARDAERAKAKAKKAKEQGQ